MGKELKINLFGDNNEPEYIPGINIEFLNGGFASIPQKYGGYVIASGCGSGKTLAIKEMILRLYRYGVVYSASTIDECNKMYEYLCIEGNKVGLTSDDIAVLHSDYYSPGVDLSIMRSNSENLHKKSVIICTHHKLLNEHPEIILKFNRLKNTKFKNNVSRSHKIISGLSDYSIYDLPRQNIFIDEVPTCNSLGIKIDAVKGSLFFEYDKTFTGRFEKEYNEELGKVVDKIDRFGNLVPEMECTGYRYPVKDLDRFEGICKEYKKSLGLFTEDCESNRMKNTILSDLIYDNLDLISNLKDSESVNLTRTMSSLLYDDMKTRLMLFEGTGDLTFYKSDLFKILDIDNKYSSPIYVDANPISFNLKRSYKNNNDFINQSEFRNIELNKTLYEVVNIINNPSSTGTLIVCWKGYKIKETEDSMDYVDTNEEFTKSYNNLFNLSNTIKSIIDSNNVNNKYEIIHYMSGLDKATNQYRDFNQIIFLGDFKVPDSVVYKFNFDYKVNTTPVLFRIYQMAQATCRLCIRENSGKPIRISYTSDIDKNVIDRLSKYLTNNPVKELDDVEIDSFDFIKPKWRYVAKLFSDLDYEFRNALLTGSRYSIKLTLDQIYSLIPMSKKEVNKYNPMIIYFRNLGIEFNLSTNSRNKGRI